MEFIYQVLFLTGFSCASNVCCQSKKRTPTINLGALGISFKYSEDYSSSGGVQQYITLHLFQTALLKKCLLKNSPL